MRVTLAFGRIGAEVTIPSHIDALVLEAEFAQALCPARRVKGDPDRMSSLKSVRRVNPITGGSRLSRRYRADTSPSSDTGAGDQS